MVKEVKASYETMSTDCQWELSMSLCLLELQLIVVNYG